LKGGNIIFLQKEIDRFSPERIVAQGIIQVPESNKLFDPLTVLENLELGAYLRFSRSNKAQIVRDLDHVYALFPVLSDRKKQLAGTLSGGERQMLALGKAMMGNPRLMMLDEPSLGLAPLVISEIFDTIESLNRGGMTFLLVEQNAKAALRISHRAYVMETGKITLTGAGEELSENVEVKRAFLGKDYREKWER
jgi:branched-chain amino acid transport system ATP-binding protein